MKPKLSVGLLAALIVTVLIWPRTTGTQALPKPTTQSSAPGRFQIVMSPNVRADTFLLDTETGDTWVQTEITDRPNNPTIWLHRQKIDDAMQLGQVGLH